MREYYGDKGQERLDTDPEDTVRSITEDEGYDDFPVKVYVFEPMDAIGEVDVYAKRILEDILENLDEDYGDPDGDIFEPTQKMKDAALKLAIVMKQEYVNFICELTGEILEYSKKETEEMR